MTEAIVTREEVDELRIRVKLMAGNIERFRKAGLTPEAIDQVVEGIEEFIISGDGEVREVWQPFIDKLQATRTVLVETFTLWGGGRV